MIYTDYEGGGMFGKQSQSDYLTIDDMHAVQQQVPGIKRVVAHGRTARDHWHRRRRPGTRRHRSSASSLVTN